MQRLGMLLVVLFPPLGLMVAGRRVAGALLLLGMAIGVASFFVSGLSALSSQLWALIPASWLTAILIGVTDPAATFASIRQGQLLLYRPDWFKGTVMHVASVKDSGGWLMSGIANATSEPYWRVTSSNFVATVAAVFIVSP